jgi:isoquinoline 1-oxidoreductase beta subunit
VESAVFNRGDFIRLTSSLGAGLALAITVPGCAPADGPSAKEFEPNAWLRIAPDDTVTMMLSKSEMGQGVATGLPTMLADELDAPMEQVRIQFAPPAPQYADVKIGLGPIMITGGSKSIANMWIPLRTAGATARAMLVAAAAKQWGVDPASLRTSDGVVSQEGSDRRASYGSLVAIAATLPVPANVPLKSPHQFTLIGKTGKTAHRIDVPNKVNGKTVFGIDVRVPGMLHAAIARSPVFGGRVTSFDATKAKAVHGVTHVVQVSNGVAVVAKNTYAAFQGQRALKIVWNEGPNAHLNTPALFAAAEELGRARKNERVALLKGTPDHVEGRVFEATYRGPLLAHATMEPQNATAHVHDGVCEVWAPTQAQTAAQQAAAKAAGVPLERVTLHTTFLGGGFGRRLETDFVTEAVEVSKAIRGPVKVQWSREDDTQHDFYRPMSVNNVRAVLHDGKVVSLSHQIVQESPSRRANPSFVKNGIDVTALPGVVDVPYRIPNMRVTYIDNENGIPTGALRAPANWNGFVTETFIDELAHATGQDPLAFRLAMLPVGSRPARVLNLAAEKAGWGKPRRPGIAQGIAFVFWSGSYGALVAEVSLQGKMPKVHRVITAIDCGTVVNPDIVVQQSQGGVNFGLSAALTGKITIQNGRVQQSNFFDYTVLHMADAPPIEVHIVASTAPPSGIGEVFVPPIAPAIANAIFKLNGKRLRSLPFSDALA